MSVDRQLGVLRPVNHSGYIKAVISEGADRVAGQLRGDKEYPFSGVTKSGRVWRKVPESDARSVHTSLCVGRAKGGRGLS